MRFARPFALAALITTLAAPAFAGPGLTVAIDHSQRLNVSRPAGSVIVGNPQVADVTVVDPHTVFVSGRGYGVSEIVVLDPLGRTIWQGDVVVTAPQTNAVTVYHGATAVEMACAATCSASMRSSKPAGAPASAPGAAPSVQPGQPTAAPQPSPGTP
jgi:hypothetical protein